jgi:hypothetical protein
MKRLPLLAGCALAVIFSAGCAAEARGTSGGQGGADSSLCSDLDAMNRAVTTAKTVNAFSTPGDVKKTRAELDRTFATVQESAEADGVDTGPLDEAVGKYLAFATRVPPGVVLGSFGSVLGGQTVVIGREVRALGEAAGCDS